MEPMPDFIQIKEVSFNEVLPVWREKVWPDKKTPIRSISPKTFLGGLRMENLKETPRFWIAYGHAQELLGVVSGHRTSEQDYRIRGLYVDPEYRNRGIGQELLKLALRAGKDAGCSLAWGLVRKKNLDVYVKFGATVHEHIEMAKIGECYVSFTISNLPDIEA